MKIEKVKIVWEDGRETEVTLPESFCGRAIFSFQKSSLTGTRLEMEIEPKNLERDRK